MTSSSLKWTSIVAVAVILTACAASPQQKAAKFLKRGNEHLARGDYARASLEFRNASAAQPKDAEPYYGMGITELRAGNIQAAVVNLRKATELNPKHERAQLKLAELMTASHIHELTERAQGILEGVLVSSPDNIEASEALAITEEQLGRTDAAIRRLEAVLKKFPNHFQSAIALADLKLAHQDPDGAGEVLKEAVASVPNSPAVAVAMGQFYASQQKMDLAEAQIRRALQLDPKNPSALLTLAALQVRSNRAAQAEQTYETISGLPDKRYRWFHAMFLFQQNQREAALAEFQKLAVEDPKDRATRTRLVAIYMAMNRTPEAQRVLDQALKRNAKDSDALLQRSELYLRAGKIDEAQKDLEKVEHFDPTSAEVRFGMATVWRLKGQLGRERQELTEAVRLNSDLLPARLALAANFLAARDTKSALEVLQQTPDSQKNRLGVVIERNWALLLAGNSREARSYINEVLRVARVPDAVLQDGVVKLGEKDYAGARTDAEEVIKTNPQNLRAVRLMIDTYAAQRQASKGLDRLRQLVSQNPESAPLQTMLGQLLIVSRNLAEARTVFDQMRRVAPQSTEADVALAALDIDDNHFVDARRRLQGVIATAPQHLRALLLLADVQMKMNDSAAIATYHSILQLDSSNVIALNNLACLLLKENPDEALKFASEAVEIAPKDPTTQDTLGWVYYRKGMYSMAVRYLRMATEKEPTPLRQFHLGSSYVKAGDRDRGQTLIRAALQKEPKLADSER